MHIVALIVGAVGLLGSAVPFLGLILGLSAMALGFLGRRKRIREGRKSQTAATLGMVLGGLSVASGLTWTMVCVAVPLLAGGQAAASTAPASEPSQPVAAQSASSSSFASLESHLHRGRTYTNGPDAELIGNLVRGAVEAGDAVAVKVIPGSPRRVVVLIRFADGQVERLRDLSRERRRQQLADIIEEIDTIYQAGADHLAVGIRGTLLYGAVAIREPGQPARFDVGTSVSTGGISAILSATPGIESEPVIAIGQTVGGRLSFDPMPAPHYFLNLSEPTVVRAKVTLTPVRRNEGAFVMVCSGRIRPNLCAERNLAVDPDDNVRRLQRNEVGYRLEAGTYTIVAEPFCDGDDAQCRDLLQDPPSYALRLR